MGHPCLPPPRPYRCGLGAAHGAAARTHTKPLGKDGPQRGDRQSEPYPRGLVSTEDICAPARGVLKVRCVFFWSASWREFKSIWVILESEIHKGRGRLWTSKGPVCVGRRGGARASPAGVGSQGPHRDAVACHDSAALFRGPFCARGSGGGPRAAATVWGAGRVSPADASPSLLRDPGRRGPHPRCQPGAQRGGRYAAPAGL